MDPRFAHQAQRRYDYQEEPKSSRAKLITGIVAVVVLAVVAVVGIWFVKQTSRGAGDTSYGAPKAGEDQAIVDSMKDLEVVELQQFLKASEDHLLMGMTRSQAMRFADRVYELGAAKAFAFRSKMSMAVVIELPDDPAKRKALFEWWQEKYFDALSQKVRNDVGQRFLLVRMHA